MSEFEPLQFYFPSPIFNQYVDILRRKNVSELGKREIIDLYYNFMVNTEPDCRNNIWLLPSIRLRFKEYREALKGLVLGYHIKLYFLRQTPKVSGFDRVDLELTVPMLEDIHNELKLRKYKVIERIIVTDMTFRLYNYLCEKYDFESVLLDYLKVKDTMKNLTNDQVDRYPIIEKKYTPYNRYHGAVGFCISYPEALNEFKRKCLPLLSWSGVIGLSMFQFFASGRWEEVRDTISKIRNVKPEKIIADPTEAFLDYYKRELNERILSYIRFVRTFIKNVEAMVQEKDPIEEFILSCLPAPVLQLCERAVEAGFDLKKVVFKVRDLIRKGVIKDYKGVLKINKA